MENIVELLSTSNSELDWKKLSKETVNNLEIPQNPSIFDNKGKNLCESAVDLVCSMTSRPCSG